MSFIWEIYYYYIVSKARTGLIWFSSLLYAMRLPLRQREATQKMNCTSDLLLVFEWVKTACGTARSNIGNGMECIFSVLLLAVAEAVWSHTITRSISAVQSILSLAPLSQRQSRPIQKWGASVLRGSLYGENCVLDVLDNCISLDTNSLPWRAIQEVVILMPKNYKLSVSGPDKGYTVKTALCLKAIFGCISLHGYSTILHRWKATAGSGCSAGCAGARDLFILTTLQKLSSVFNNVQITTKMLKNKYQNVYWWLIIY